MGAWTRASKLSSGSIEALGSNLLWTRLINIKKRSLVVVVERLLVMKLRN